MPESNPVENESNLVENERNPVDKASSLFGGLLGEEARNSDAPLVRHVFDAFRRFERVEFDTPDVPEADGFLFEYGNLDRPGPPMFSIRLIRRLKKSDEAEEQQSHVQ